MITETQIIARFTRLEAHTLSRWIAAGWVKPREGAAGFLFDNADVARIYLLCDLCYEMEVRDEELALVLSLVDRLNGIRTMLMAVNAAVQDQPAEIREAIMTRVEVHLSGQN